MERRATVAWWVGLGLASMVASATGCNSEEKLKAIDELKPRMETALSELGEVKSKLPAAGAEKVLPCEAPPSEAVVISEASLERALGTKDDLSPVEHTVAGSFDRGDSALVSLKRLESWKTNTDVVSGTVIIAGRELEEYGKTPTLVVVRTQETELGKMSGKTIEKNGRWKGWAFAFDKKTRKLIGAASADAESPDQVYTMKEKGKAVSKNLLLGRAAGQAIARLKKALPCVKWPG